MAVDMARLLGPRLVPPYYNTGWVDLGRVTGSPVGKEGGGRQWGVEEPLRERMRSPALGICQWPSWFCHPHTPRRLIYEMFFSQVTRSAKVFNKENVLQENLTKV